MKPNEPGAEGAHRNRVSRGREGVTGVRESGGVSHPPKLGPRAPRVFGSDLETASKKHAAVF